MRWLREPIVHFVAIGVALFALDAVMANDDTPAEPPARPPIVITQGISDELAAGFRAEVGRDPDAEELDAQVQRWVTEEALRREAIALGLDDNDPIIRRRLVQNMRFILESAEPSEEPTEAQVDAWLAENLPAPEIRARVDFVQVFVDAARHESPAETALALRRELEAGADPMTLGDPFIRGRTFTNVGRNEIGRLLGESAAAQVLALTQGEWSEPIESPYGVHVVQVTERRVPPSSGTDAERDAARRALSRESTQQAEDAAIREVVDKYEVVREDQGGGATAGSGAAP